MGKEDPWLWLSFDGEPLSRRDFQSVVDRFKKRNNIAVISYGHSHDGTSDIFLAAEDSSCDAYDATMFFLRELQPAVLMSSVPWGYLSYPMLMLGEF